MPFIRGRKTNILTVILLFFAGVASSQTNDEGLAFLQFNFFNPGARSLGMAGAFVGLADDATAALANPAGLTILIHPEASVEMSATTYRNEVPWHSGNRTSIEVPPDFIEEADFRFEFETEEFPRTVQNISFASFVYPVQKNRLVVSGFYNEQTKFRREFQTEGFCRRLDAGNCVSSFPPTDNSLNMSIKNIGASFSYQPRESWNFGGTVNYSHLDLESETLTTSPDFGNSVSSITSIAGTDSKISFTVGVLFRLPKRISAGLVYSKRPKFDLTSTFDLTPLVPLSGKSIRPETLKIPDSFGAGVSWQPQDTLTINLDLVRVQYAQLMDGYYNRYFHPFFCERLERPQECKRNWEESTHEVENGAEFRAGMEYVLFVKNYPLSLRAGYWNEPFHSMVRTVDDSDLSILPTTESLGEPFFSRSFKKNTHHLTFGSGLVVDQITIDWAFDYSKNYRRLVVSTVFYLN